jgi:hypothetical protein
VHAEPRDFIACIAFILQGKTGGRSDPNEPNSVADVTFLNVTPLNASKSAAMVVGAIGVRSTRESQLVQL